MKEAKKMVLADVNLITLTDNQVLYHQDLLVENGYIGSIVPHKSLSEENFEVLDCKDKYVIPSFTDSHVHVVCADSLEWFLGYGVTSVINMQGVSTHLQWKKEVALGERIGSDIFTTGPIIDGRDEFVRFSKAYKKAPRLPADELYPNILFYEGLMIATKPEEARKCVRYTKAAGYDFVKVYSNVTREVYYAICEEAEEVGIDVIGHIPDCINSDYSDDADNFQIKQKTIEHVSSINEKIIKKMLKSNVYLDTTLAVEKVHMQKQIDNPDYKSRMELMNPAVLNQWEESKKNHMEGYQEVKGRRKTIHHDPEYYAKMIRIFVDGGGKILAGTDGALEYMIPGYTLHKELEFLVEYGLNELEALKTATVNPSIFLKKEKEIGTIEVGKKSKTFGFRRKSSRKYY